MERNVILVGRESWYVKSFASAELFYFVKAIIIYILVIICYSIGGYLRINFLSGRVTMLVSPRIFALIVMFVWYFPVDQIWWIWKNAPGSSQTFYKFMNMDLCSAFWLFCYYLLCFINQPWKFCRSWFIGFSEGDDLVRDNRFGLIVAICIAGLFSQIFYVGILVYWIYLLISGGLPKFWRQMLIWY